MRSMREVEKSWLAAVLDTDGSVAWWNASQSRKRRAAIQITNSCPELVEHAQKLIGYGNIKRVKPRSDTRLKDGPKKLLYTLRFTKRDIVVHVIKEVLPYLIAKKDIAEEIIKTPFVDLRKTREHHKDERGQYIT